LTAQTRSIKGEVWGALFCDLPYIKKVSEFSKLSTSLRIKLCIQKSTCPFFTWLEKMGKVGPKKVEAKFQL
jgi:hypothetical protein